MSSSLKSRLVSSDDRKNPHPPRVIAQAIVPPPFALDLLKHRKLLHHVSIFVHKTVPFCRTGIFTHVIIFSASSHQISCLQTVASLPVDG